MIRRNAECLDQFGTVLVKNIFIDCVRQSWTDSRKPRRPNSRLLARQPPRRPRQPPRRPRQLPRSKLIDREERWRNFVPVNCFAASSWIACLICHLARPPERGAEIVFWFFRLFFNLFEIQLPISSLNFSLFQFLFQSFFLFQLHPQEPPRRAQRAA